MLIRKMLRDLLENKTAYFASLVIIIIGLLIYTSISIVMDNLYAAKYSFYEEARFADGFAVLSGMPKAHVDRLSRVEGILEIEGRIVKDVRVLRLKTDRNVYLRLVSIPEKADYHINMPLLAEGYPKRSGSRDLWLNPAFFETHGFALGDEIHLLAQGRSFTFTIRGTARSPEFVYALRTGREIYPSPQTFGIAFVPYHIMETLFGEHDRVNDLVFLLRPGYSYEDIEESLERRLLPYGLISLFPREDQISHSLLAMELEGLETSSTAMPLVFLSVAGIILYILLKRMIDQQRGQIGTLKAFGYTNMELFLHYISYSLFLGLLGGVVGGLLGVWLSFSFTEMYAMFFELPMLGEFTSYLYLYVGYGILLSLAICTLAGYYGCRAALKLRPAEAMRPAAPPPGKRTLVERFKPLWKLLSVQAKMATRNAFRYKKRSAFTIIGVIFAFGLMAVTWYFNTITDVLLFDQLEKVQTHDLKLSFTGPVTFGKAMGELNRFPEIGRIEHMLEVPATLKHPWTEQDEDTVILGLAQNASLYNLFNKEGERVLPPREGLLLSQRLADQLDVRAGSVLVLESYLLKDPITVDVAGIIVQNVGSNAYMEINALSNLLGFKPTATSALLTIEDEDIELLRNHYRESDLVVSMDSRTELLASFEEMMASFGFMQYIMALFGFIIAFAIIYTSSIVSLSERKRELATLKVIGMTRNEVLRVIAYEQWLVGIFGMLAGIPFTLFLVHSMSNAISSDIFSIPVIVEAPMFIIGALGTALSIMAAQLTVARRIGKLSLVEVLKERD